MFRHIHDQMEAFTCTFEITVDGVTKSQTMQAPRMMIEQQFISLLQDIQQMRKPAKIKLSRPVEIWDQFSQRMLRNENSITVMNRAYTDAEEL